MSAARLKGIQMQICHTLNRLACHHRQSIMRGSISWCDFDTRETALRLNLFGRFTYTQESFIDLASKGVVMAEVALPVEGNRRHGQSRMAHSLWRYGVRSLAIILRSLRDVRPLLFFGVIACVFMVLGLVQGVFVFGWWLRTGGTSGFQSLLLGGGVCIILGFLSGILALIADMLGRLKQVQEELLYLAKKRRYDQERYDD